MSRIQAAGRWFFGVCCVASGLQIATYVFERISRDYDWPRHIFTIAMVFCSFTAAYGLFARQRWFFRPSIVVAAYAVIVGLVGIFFSPTVSLNFVVSLIYSCLGISFLGWLLLSGIRPGSHAESA